MPSVFSDSKPPVSLHSLFYFLIKVQLTYSVILASGTKGNDSVFFQIICHSKLLQDNGCKVPCYTIYSYYLSTSNECSLHLQAKEVSGIFKQKKKKKNQQNFRLLLINRGYRNKKRVKMTEDQTWLSRSEFIFLII